MTRYKLLNATCHWMIGPATFIEGMFLFVI